MLEGDEEEDGETSGEGRYDRSEVLGDSWNKEVPSGIFSRIGGYSSMMQRGSYFWSRDLYHEDDDGDVAKR